MVKIQTAIYRAIICFIKKYYWVLIGAFFIATRLLGLFNFGPHNDEMIYTQYAQLINSNWHENWDISMDGRMYGDYKDPLQYWLTSATVYAFKNPVIGVRLLSFVISVIGFYFFIKFVKKAIGDKEAVIVAILWISSSYYFYFDILGIAEVYVYSLSACLLYALYKVSLFDEWKKRLYFGVWPLIFLMLLALLSKQSAVVFLPVLFLSPFLYKNLKKPWVLVGLLSGCFVIAKTIYWWSIGGEYAEVRTKGFALLINTYSFKEILSFPVISWIGNLKFYFFKILLADWTIILGLVFYFLCLGAIIITKKRLSLPKKYWLILLIWLASFIPAIIFLKNHNARHYGMFLFISYSFLSILLVDIFKQVKVRLLNLFILFLSVLAVGQIIFLTHDVVNYNATNLSHMELGDVSSTPIGIKQLIAKIKNLPTGVLLYDEQWGNPGTAIQVYADYYPQLLLYRLGHDRAFLLDVYKTVSSNNGELYLVFDLWANGQRPWATEFYNDEFLCGNKEVIHRGYKNILYKNTTLVFCHVGASVKEQQIYIP